MKTKTINIHEVVIRLEIDADDAEQMCDDFGAGISLDQAIRAHCDDMSYDALRIEIDGKVEYDSEAPRKKAKKKNGGTR